MNNITLKNAAVIATLMGGFVAAPAAHAVVVAGNLGAGALSTDLYRVTCPIGTTRLSGTVTDLGFGSNGVSVRLAFVEVHPTGAISATAIDNENPFPFVFPSAATSLVRGAGQYYMYVWKDGAAIAESYSVNYNCLNIFGAALGSARVTLQSQ